MPPPPLQYNDGRCRDGPSSAAAAGVFTRPIVASDGVLSGSTLLNGGLGDGVVVGAGLGRVVGTGVAGLDGVVVGGLDGVVGTGVVGTRLGGVVGNRLVGAGYKW